MTTTTLTGDVTGRVALTSSGNAVSKLGNFTSTLGFALTNNKPLAVTGAVNGGGFDVTVNNSASLGINGKISASQISLSGSSINISGTINGTSNFIHGPGQSDSDRWRDHRGSYRIDHRPQRIIGEHTGYRRRYIAHQHSQSDHRE